MKLVKLVYHGVHDAIEIDLPNGGLLKAKFGEVFEASEVMAASLLDQAENFTLAVEEKVKKEKAPATAAPATPPVEPTAPETPEAPAAPETPEVDASEKE